MIFVDTSAFLAILNIEDNNYEKAKKKWEEIILSGETLFCTNYVLVETMALIQKRFGIKSSRTFQDDIVPLLTVEWVNAFIHQVAVTGLLAANRRDLSLVDCTSFVIMRKLGIKSVFTFDHHFKEQGFLCITD